MVAVIICSVTTASMISVGCALETGKLMVQSTTNVLDTKKIQT